MLTGLRPLFYDLAQFGGNYWVLKNLIVNTYEYLIINYLIAVKGSRWYEKFGLSQNQAMIVIGKYRWLIINDKYQFPSNADSPKVATAKYETVCRQIAKDMKLPITGNYYQGIYSIVYAVMHNIPASQDTFYDYVRGGKTELDFIKNLPSNAIDAIDKAIDQMPWYLKPMTLLIVGGGILVAYMFGGAIRITSTGYAKRRFA